MRTFIVASALMALIACGANGDSQDSELANSSNTERPGTSEPEKLALQAPPITPGKYQMVVDGQVMGTAIFADGGQFAQIEPDGMTVPGTYAFDDKGRLCLKVGVNEEPACFGVGERQANGSWEITAPDGTTGTMVPVAQ